MEHAEVILGLVAEHMLLPDATRVRRVSRYMHAEVQARDLDAYFTIRRTWRAWRSLRPRARVNSWRRRLHGPEDPCATLGAGIIYPNAFDLAGCGESACS